MVCAWFLLDSFRFLVSAAQLWSLQKALFDTWMHELRLKDGEGKRRCLLGRIEDQPQIQGLSVGAAALSAPLFLWSWVMHSAGSQAGCEAGRELAPRAH